MSVYVSGLLATSLVIVIAMANSQRLLLGLGVLSLVSYIFWYYYQLDTSLLVKSGSMLIIAITILLIRWLLVSRYFAGDLSLYPTSKTLPKMTSGSNGHNVNNANNGNSRDSQEDSL